MTIKGDYTMQHHYLFNTSNFYSTVFTI